MKLGASVFILLIALFFLVARIAGKGGEPVRAEAQRPQQAQQVQVLPPPSPAPTASPEAGNPTGNTSGLHLQETLPEAPLKKEEVGAKEQKDTKDTKEKDAKEERTGLCPCPENEKRKDTGRVKQVKGIRKGEVKEKKEEEREKGKKAVRLEDYGLVCKVGGECVLYKDGQVIKEGDQFEGGRIVKISPSGVLLEEGGRRKLVEFK